jgi:DMSO reductase anchor subunit
VKRHLAWFLVGGVTFWAAATGVAWLFWDEEKAGPFLEALPAIAVAAGLCLVPSALTLVWTTWSSVSSPEQQLTATLGGTGVRMFVVLAVGLGLTMNAPYFEERRQSFWMWVLIFYLYDLGLEIAILLLGRSTASAQGAERPS